MLLMLCDAGIQMMQSTTQMAFIALHVCKQFAHFPVNLTYCGRGVGLRVSQWNMSLVNPTCSRNYRGGGECGENSEVALGTL